MQSSVSHSSTRTEDVYYLGCFFPVSCISDETVRQFSARDQLSKRYEVPVFKFIGSDNRASESAHTDKLSAVSCPLSYCTLNPAALSLLTSWANS